MGYVAPKPWRRRAKRIEPRGQFETSGLTKAGLSLAVAGVILLVIWLLMNVL